MNRLLVVLAAVAATLALAGPAAAAGSSSIAALQVALRAHGHYPAPVDGIDGPLTRTGLTTFQSRVGLPPRGRVDEATRAALGDLGRPLLGRRELSVGAVGWDVSSLEFRLIPYGLAPRAVDGRFTSETAKALLRLQAQRGLVRDGIAGKRTFEALGARTRVTAAFMPPVRAIHVVVAGDSFFSIAERYGISPLQLAKGSGLKLSSTIVPGQRLTLPTGTPTTSSPVRAAAPSVVVVSNDAVRESLDHWSAVYGVDPRLARATAWMESGFRSDVVSSAGALGIMQLLPGTWQWVDKVLLRTTTQRTYDGNIQAGVRYLRWLLDQFHGDRSLALAGYYQGAQAVRDRGLFDETKRYVAIILKLYGTV